MQTLESISFSQLNFSLSVLRS